MTRLRVFTLLALWLAGAALVAAVGPALSYADSPTTDMVSPDKAAAASVDTFYRLTGCDAEFVDTETYLVYQAGTQAALERAEIELEPKDYLVKIYARTLRRAFNIYQNPVVGQTLNAFSRSEDVYVEGIVGRVWVDIETGAPYHVAGSKRPRPRLNMLAVDPDDAWRTAETMASGALDGPYLFEATDYVYAWCYMDDIQTHYVDARTGNYLSGEEMGERVQEIEEIRAAMPEDCGGTSHWTLSPAFIEQGLHQNQHESLLENPDDGALCGPTSLAMIFDYWGEHIDKLDVADVSTEFAGGDCDGTCRPDLERAGMFSHNSDSHESTEEDRWEHNDDGRVLDGYEERVYGYTAARAEFGGEVEAWDSLVELIQEHCPFIAHITGHYLVVVGYAIDGNDEWVSCADPADPDLEWDDWDNRTWDNFNNTWANRNYRAFVIRPMPVEMEFLPDTPQNGQFTIRATVRTCHEYPDAAAGAWTVVNRGCELKGNSSGTSQNCPVTIDYPPNVTKISGAATQSFNPVGVDDSDTFSWVFSQNGNERDGEFKVVVKGWATDIDSTNYTDEKDELFGWGVIRIDDRLFRIKDSTGNTVAAIGDQGNIYLADSAGLSEWTSSVDATVDSEFLIRSGNTNVAKFSDDGTLDILRLCHGGMDDVNDTGWEVMAWTPWLLDLAIDDDDTELDYDPYGAAWDLRYDFPFYIRIHDEVMKVTGFDGQQPEAFDVVRAQEGTDARDYDAGAAITLYAKATLKSAITSTSTSLTFDETQGDKFPLAFLSYDYPDHPFVSGDFSRRFCVKIDSEILLVTNVQFSEQNETYTFTVVRARGGTDAASHALGASVFLNLGEQFALNMVHDNWSNADKKAVKVKDAHGNVVAYIDEDGDIRHKGMVFENWSDWDYWD